MFSWVRKGKNLGFFVVVVFLQVSFAKIYNGKNIKIFVLLLLHAIKSYDLSQGTSQHVSFL